MVMQSPSRKHSVFRPFWQKQGTVVQGTWVWVPFSNQTNFASLSNEGAGFWFNNAPANLDEYKWNNIFLTKGTYKLTLITEMSYEDGIAEILFGTTSLGTKDMYDTGILWNQVWEITFTLTIDTTADLRFRCNGKNAASTSYYVTFSRFQLERTG